MLPGFGEFKKLSDTRSIKMSNKHFNESINNINFLQLINNNDLKEEIKIKLIKSDFILIDNYEFNFTKYFIVCFNEQLIIIEQTNQFILNELFKNDLNEEKFYFLSNSRKDFIRIFHFATQKIQKTSSLTNEIYSFDQAIKIKSKEKSIIQIWLIIKSCLLGYFILKGYYKCKINRIRLFQSNPKQFINIEQRTFSAEEFITLRLIDSGTNTFVYLNYHLKLEQLFAVKQSNANDNKLVNREIKNYKRICHPLFPRFYGTVKIHGDNFIVIEYIHGITLNKIKEITFPFGRKFEALGCILYTFEYLHKYDFIYRDLKPNNIIIDDNYFPVIFDFDRMINDDEENDDKNAEFTNYLNTCYHAPELDIPGLKPTTKSDIYSIGKLIYFILFEKSPSDGINQNQIEMFERKCPPLFRIYENCTHEDPKKRLSIKEIIKLFKQNFLEILGLKNTYISFKEIENLKVAFENFFLVLEKINKILFKYNPTKEMKTNTEKQKIVSAFYQKDLFVNDIDDFIFNAQIYAKQNNPYALFTLAILYYEGIYLKRDINKTIQYLTKLSDLNIPKAQYYLGKFYIDGENFPHDINKSLYYLNLASNLNFAEAQFDLGLIYYEGKFVEQNIEKSIHFFSLAANQMHPVALYYLGIIYEDGKYITRDINKSIRYFTLSSNLNQKEAQYSLGKIYYKGEYVARDINKSIHYLTLAANQNDVNSQNLLGYIFAKGNYVKCDINKSIYYYQLAANQNFPLSLTNLGILYYEKMFGNQNIDKSIYYLTQASNLNYSTAQYILGVFYHEGKYIPRDINKSIHYYTLASNQNHVNALYNLGCLYMEGKYVNQDIKKAIHYLTLAANLNSSEAQFMLANIYIFPEYNVQDINKSVYYYKLAADQNDSDAQCRLGIILLEGEYVPQDITKSIYYLTLSACNGNSEAQYQLGVIYYNGMYVDQNIGKALYFLNCSIKQNHHPAQVFLAGVYLEGKYVKRDVKKSIGLYKESTVLTNTIAKHVLGIFFKNGHDSIEKNINLAKEYLRESIRETNYALSMHSLAIILLDEAQEENSNDKINESIQLLIKSDLHSFNKSGILLCLLLIKRFDSINYEFIKNKVRTNFKEWKEIIQIISKHYKSVLNMISWPNSFENVFYYHLMNDYLIINSKLYTYDQLINQNCFENINHNHIIPTLTEDFYKGFGEDLLS